jgi:hypothetical protein
MDASRSSVGGGTNGALSLQVRAAMTDRLLGSVRIAAAVIPPVSATVGNTDRQQCDAVSYYRVSRKLHI